jgi:hypothetical protein
VRETHHNPYLALRFTHPTKIHKLTITENYCQRTMSNRRHRRSRFEDKAKTDSKNAPDHPASAQTKSPEKEVVRRDGPMPHPSRPTALQKCLLAAAVTLEIVWIVFLVVLAATK